MTVTYVTGDLFDQQDVDALGHGCNTVGAMGAGIATEFRRRWPDMYATYRQACADQTFTIGSILPWQIAPGRWVYNLATQARPGRYARLDAISDSLEAALEHADSHHVTSLALPRIGAGIGGLAWTDVAATIETAAADSPVTVRIVTPPARHPR